MSVQGNKYTYDGTFEGYLCAVLAALRSGRVPAAIIDRRTLKTGDETVFQDTINIQTNLKDAQYLYSMISSKSSAEVQQMTADYFLTDSAGREINLYKMIFCSLKYGARVADDYSSELMNGIQMAIRDLYREAQQLLRELDFYLGEEAASCMINPTNSVLPIIRKSILNRREFDDLIVFDKRHHLLLERFAGQNMLLDISEFPTPEFKNPKEAYDCLWPFVRDRRFDVRVIPGQKKSGSTIEPLWLKAS